MVKEILWRNGVGHLGLRTVMSISAIGHPFTPFQSHSLIPPPGLIGFIRSVGAALRMLNASIRFDLPEAFGPIKTLRDLISISSVELPKERKFLSLMD